MKTLLSLSFMVVIAAFAIPALAQVSQPAPVVPKPNVATPQSVRPAPDQARLKACTALAAKVEEKERGAFIKFCVDDKGDLGVVTMKWDLKKNKEALAVPVPR